MGLSYLIYGAVGVAAGAVLMGNLSPLFVPSPETVTTQYLAKARLQTLDGKNTSFDEADRLTSLLPEMKAQGVRLYGVLHETLGAEDFKPFLGGDVLYDPERAFYGPQERWLSVSAILSFKTLKQVVQSHRKGTPGNLKGEGRLLGAVFVLGPGDQGLIYQHHERVYGDFADLEEVKEAINKIKKLQ